jgi:hypothetical protein
MIPATIATAVAPETIARSRACSTIPRSTSSANSPERARRAGATGVALALNSAGAEHFLHITDDGHGIADPVSIVTLGRLGWSDETRRAEDPPAWACTSLAGRDVIIRSFSKPDRQRLDGAYPGLGVGDEPPDRDRTRSDHARHRDHRARARRVAEDARARRGPRRQTLSGSRDLERRGPSAGGLAEGRGPCRRWYGVRIGVFQKHPSHYSSRDGRLNFHGLTIPCDLPYVQEVDRGGHWIARVDIFDAPQIQLVLPARKEVVENTGIAALRDAVQLAIYRAIEAARTHRLSAHDWREARSLGIALPEAEPYLFAWTAYAADSSRNYERRTRDRHRHGADARLRCADRPTRAGGDREA